MDKETEKLIEALELAKKETAKVIIGQEDIINKLLIAIFTNNHVLIEGVPGIAKTLLVRTLSKILGSDFSRIQFTPDLMPADITGTHVFNMQKGNFSLVKGPVFTTFLLADEINRAPAKTQSALLEAMQERTVTIDRRTHELSSNFTVFATQNPIEHEGTYPLPEAQKDRFMLKVNMNPPSFEDELLLAKRMIGDDSPENVLQKDEIQAILTPEILESLRKNLNEIIISDDLVDYIVKLVRKTRTHQSILNGAGPRATQALILSSRAYAAISGRNFVIPDDVKYMSGSVLEHRIILRPEYEIEGLTEQEVIVQILQDTAVPR
ncbi:MAG: MoxR family ATPase [Desulfobacterales bacterium]|nr:MoxR family ATPase [Desulfobacterales bacterium]